MSKRVRGNPISMPKTETTETDWEGTDRYYALSYHQRAIKLQFPPTPKMAVRLDSSEK